MLKFVVDTSSGIRFSKSEIINEKIERLRLDILACMRVCQIELENRKNGIDGESTIEQLEEWIVPDLTNMLKIVENKKIPKERKDRWLESFANAFRGWEWHEPTELYTRLTNIHHDYQNIYPK